MVGSLLLYNVATVPTFCFKSIYRHDPSISSALGKPRTWEKVKRAGSQELYSGTHYPGQVSYSLNLPHHQHSLLPFVHYCHHPYHAQLFVPINYHHLSATIRPFFSNPAPWTIFFLCLEHLSAAIWLPFRHSFETPFWLPQATIQNFSWSTIGLSTRELYSI